VKTKQREVRHNVAVKLQPETLYVMVETVAAAVVCQPPWIIT